VIVDRKLAPLDNPPQAFSWTFPEPFGVQEMTELPFTETVVIGRHLQVSHLHTYLNLAPLRDLRDSTTPAPEAVDDRGRSSQVFLVDVIVRKGMETRRVITRGRDIYAFTAPLVVEAVRRILDGTAEGAGVLAPAEIFDAPSFLQALSPEFLTFESEVGIKRPTVGGVPVQSSTHPHVPRPVMG
jgi:hypothetical protein